MGNRTSIMNLHSPMGKWGNGGEDYYNKKKAEDHLSSAFLESIYLVRLDLNIHAHRQVELAQRAHGLGRRIENINHAFVCADFELFARLLVHVRAAQHRV